MVLLLIRHGESEADLLDVHEGRADFELTDRGHIQAQAMADFVKQEYKVTKISDAIGIKVNYEEDLMEFNNGLLAGMSREEAAIKYPIIRSVQGMVKALNGYLFWNSGCMQS